MEELPRWDGDPDLSSSKSSQGVAAVWLSRGGLSGLCGKLTEADILLSVPKLVPQIEVCA